VAERLRTIIELAKSNLRTLTGVLRETQGVFRSAGRGVQGHARESKELPGAEEAKVERQRAIVERRRRDLSGDDEGSAERILDRTKRHLVGGRGATLKSALSVALAHDPAQALLLKAGSAPGAIGDVADLAQFVQGIVLEQVAKAQAERLAPVLADHALRMDAIEERLESQLDPEAIATEASERDRLTERFHRSGFAPSGDLSGF